MCSLNKLKLNKLNCGVGELGRNEGEIDSISNWKIMQEKSCVQEQNNGFSVVYFYVFIIPSALILTYSPSNSFLFQKIQSTG
jgi:hypothetical protein